MPSGAVLRFTCDLATAHVPVILTALLLLAIGYLLGAIPSGYLAGRWLRGIDLRECGSGSTGATNVLRNVGKGPALAVFLIDVGQGALAVLLAKSFGLSDWLQVLAATTLESETIRKIEITAMNRPKQASPTGQASPRNMPRPVATALPPFQPSHTGQM